MTATDKPVTRRTKIEHPSRKRRVIATLGPGDVVTLRLERSSKVHHKCLFELYSQLELRDAAAVTGANISPCKNPMSVRNV